LVLVPSRNYRVSSVVNVDLEAVISLVVRGIHEQEREIEAVIDTGFSGYLTLPPSLNLCTWPPLENSAAGHTCRRGSLRVFDVYAATVLWDGQARIVEVDAADAEPLVGMGLMQGYDLHIEVVEGGTVTIEALS
jgi:predicted aspartyl protease